MTGMTQKSCEVMWKASTVGFTTGWEINCPKTTLTVTRIDRIDRTDTYFRESTARRQGGRVMCTLHHAQREHEQQADAAHHHGAALEQRDVGEQELEHVQEEIACG